VAAEAKILERTLDGYQLTRTGKELFVILEPFKDWALKWAKTVK
jgi:DNA-binding HxlR family transcriptional regulator